MIFEVILGRKMWFFDIIFSRKCDFWSYFRSENVIFNVTLYWKCDFWCFFLVGILSTRNRQGSRGLISHFVVHILRNFKTFVNLLCRTRGRTSSMKTWLTAKPHTALMTCSCPDGWRRNISKRRNFRRSSSAFGDISISYINIRTLRILILFLPEAFSSLSLGEDILGWR